MKMGTELVKTESSKLRVLNDSISKYGQTYGIIISSRINEPKVGDLTINKASLDVIDSISRANLILGIKNYTQEDIENTSTWLIEDLKKSNPNLTIGEINLAIEQGSKMPGYMMVSVNVCLEWVRIFKETIRKEALALQVKMLNEEFELQELKKFEQGQQQFRNEIELMYQEFIKTGTIDHYDLHFKAYAYNHIKSSGIFEISIDKAKEMYAEVFAKQPEPDTKKIGFDPLVEQKTREYNTKQICRSQSLLIAFEMFKFNEQETVFDYE